MMNPSPAGAGAAASPAVTLTVQQLDELDALLDAQSAGGDYAAAMRYVTDAPTAMRALGSSGWRGRSLLNVTHRRGYRSRGRTLVSGSSFRSSGLRVDVRAHHRRPPNSSSCTQAWSQPATAQSSPLRSTSRTHTGRGGSNTITRGSDTCTTIRGDQ